MPLPTILRVLGAAAFVMIPAAQPAWAGPTASLTGRVTDNTGAPVADVKVEGVDIETNQAFATRTNRDGLYSLPNLSPGRYRVVVSKLGMRTVVKPGLELHVQDVVALNFSMQAGSMIESVTVPAGAPSSRSKTRCWAPSSASGRSPNFLPLPATRMTSWFLARAPPLS